MPLDEKEKEALKERYKEHRQAIWFGKHSLKLKRKKSKLNDDSFTIRDKAEVKTEISPEPPMPSVEIETVASGKALRQRDLPNADYGRQNQVIMLRRAKKKRSQTKMTPSVSERTTLYDPESTPNEKVKLSPDITGKTRLDNKTTALEQNGTQADFYSADMRRARDSISTRQTKLNVAESPTKLEATAAQSPTLEKILKEKIKSQRQEIWSGVSYREKRRPKLTKQNGKKSAEDLSAVSVPDSQDAKQGLTLGVVFIGIIAVAAAIALGVLLGYLLA